MPRLRFLLLCLLLCLLSACERDDSLSLDADRSDLLPDTGDYLDEDYGTQTLALTVAGDYDSQIGLIYYDDETRTIPLLYLTQGEQTLRLLALENGALEFGFDGFNTAFMPLELSARFKVLLEEKGDTIFMRGTDGIIRTASPEGEIGTPLPESDDGELTGYYLKADRKIVLQVDLMLPIPIKATVKGTQNQHP